MLWYLWIYFLKLFWNKYIQVQWNCNLRKPYYSKISEYETDFEEISVPFNKKKKKTFKIRKRKLKVPDSKGKVSLFVTFIMTFSLILLFPHCFFFFNIYLNDYIGINEHNPAVAGGV